MSYIISHSGQVLALTARHLQITLIAVALAVAVGVPLGVLVTRWRWLYSPILGVTGMLYTVPSLALFAFLLPFLGLGVRPTIVALILYSQLAIVRNTAVGIFNIDKAIIESATGMGMTSWQILHVVELPLAFPVIMAGIRTVVVMDIGVATIAAYIGAGGLGTLIYQGITSVYPDKILAGAIPVAVLALASDFLLSRLEQRLKPRGMGR